MKRNVCEALSLMVLVAIIISAVANVAAEDLDFHMESVILTLYQDGLVHVTQVVRVNETIPEINLPLLSVSVSNVLIIDENKSVLDYEIDGSNITIFTLGATKATLEYDTASLTSMQAGVWTLSFESLYNMTVRLPEDAEVIFLNEVPLSINTEDDRITLYLFPSIWEISYVLPIAPLVDFKVTNLQVAPDEAELGEEVTVSVLVTNAGREAGSYDVVLKINGSIKDTKTVMLSGGESIEVKFKISSEKAGTYTVEVADLKGEFKVKEASSTMSPAVEYMVFILIVSAVVVILFTRRKRKPNIEKIIKNHPYLRQEERDVLIFLAENNGKAFESEIRNRFPEIPRTSLWRLIRRLEKAEIVKIRKVGPGNMVELNK
ncbi:TPA: hypothetical protein EYP75_03695 [Candidatus Bathyarchaeota archaeon]|nr:hypothetical protein [Candidatus Bathyarchaeota archaeon]